jgi:hypothetical protein
MSDTNSTAAAPEAAAETSNELLEGESLDEGAEAASGQPGDAAAQAAADKVGAEAQAKEAGKPQMFRVKIDGKEVDLTETELKKYASLGKSAQKRMEEAAIIRKENEAIKKDIETFFNMLRNDPLSILSDESLGLNKQKIAEMIMNEEIERAKKSPEQLEKEKLQKELEAAQRKIKEAEEGKKREEWERLQNEAAASIERDIMEALDTKELPKSPYVINRMINMLHLAAQNRINLSAKDVLPIVKKQIMDDFKGLSGLLPEEQLEAILGDDKVKALRRRYLQKVKAQQAQTASVKDVKSTGGDVKSQTSDKKGKQPLNARDFFKKIGSI